MKQQGQHSAWSVAFLACAAFSSAACGADAGIGSDTAGGAASGSVAAGGNLAAGGSAGSGGNSAPTAGETSGAAGSLVTAGASSGDAGGAGMGGAAGASGGVTGNFGGNAGSGGSAGNGGSAGGASDMPYGPVSCSPVFETACKPNIQFTNGDPGGRGKVFTNVIPDVETTMKDVACRVCSILYRSPSEIPPNKHPSTIKLVLDEHGGVAQAGGDTIQFDLNYINGYANQSAAVTKTEMLGVLQHETVHLYQNYGNGGTGEGMADYVRIRVGLYEPGRRRPGGSWHDPYTTSGFFYSWLAGPCKYHADGRAMHDVNIGYLINNTLAQPGDPFVNVSALLEQQFGKNADELWAEYQAAIK